MSKKDTDVYMQKIRKRASETGTVMEKIRTDRMAELDKMRIDAEMEDVKAKIEASRAKAKIAQQASQPTVTTQNFASTLFAGRNPQQVKEILDGLGEEQIQKMVLIANASNPNSQAMLMNLLSQKGTSVNDTVQLVKTIVEMNRPQTPQQQGITLAGMASLITALDKRNKQTQTQNQPDPYIELFKSTLNELQEQRKHSQQQEMLRIRKEMADLRSRPSAMAELASDAKKYETYKKMFGGEQRVDEIALRLEAMKQSERQDDRKLNWEMEKYKMEKESTGQLIEGVKGIFQGPVGKAIEAIGGGAADRVRGGGKQQEGKQLVKAQCPSCKGIFMANPQLSQISCPQCGATLSKDPPAQQEPIIREVTPEPKVSEKQEEPKRAAKRKKT